ncbi:MAG TPA: DNA alkylation repair protein [Candidatus Limnocylindria bacterium]|jgi:3-methyladenine DNA glycosylase AlkD|nr:DNA alkylation repair protein [Candidatus Limnocylindria bacterium]
MDANARADLVTDELRAAGNPDRAEQEKAYLKSNLEFFGESVWEIRRVVQAFVRGAKPLTYADLVALVEALWGEPVFERRMASVVLLELHPKLLGAADLLLIERLLRESLTWALVDALATDVIGGILARSPAEVRPILDRWATDPDFWIRRASLLAELQPLRKGADLAPFLRHADAMLDEKEFFIRKAIGWVLREVGKRRPVEVVAWIAPRTDRASGVTMREVVRHLPTADAERLMAAYREKRPA